MGICLPSCVLSGYVRFSAMDMLGCWLAVLQEGFHACVLTLPACRASTLAQQAFCSSFQGSRSPDVARVEISEGACMRFVRSSAALTLTLDHTAKHLLESDVRLFRKYFWNRPLLHEVGTAWPRAATGCWQSFLAVLHE